MTTHANPVTLPAPVARPDNHLFTVSAVYEAFSRGDVPSMLGLLSDDVAFDAEEPASTAAAAGHPLLSPRRGKDDVRDFFATFAQCELHAFELIDLMSSTDQVAVHVFIDYTTPAGVRLQDDEIHRWTFAADGRAATLKHYVDTARHLAAWFPDR